MPIYEQILEKLNEISQILQKLPDPHGLSAGTAAPRCIICGKRGHILAGGTIWCLDHVPNRFPGMI